MGIESIAMLISASVILLLGSVHLIYTFRGPKLRPRDENTIAAMRSSSLVLSGDTTVWRAWLGFNASHSMAAILFGAVYGYLAVRHPGVLYGSVFLQTVGVLFLVVFVVLAQRYWFKVPLIGISIALACFLLSVLLARYPT